MDQIPVGLVGYGTGGSLFHAPFIATTPGLRLAAVATSRREQVERDLPGASVFPTAGDLIAQSSVALVVISTPTHTHYELARQALEAGKGVVVDKPFTATVEQADELIQLARDGNVFLSVYQNRRWDGDFRTARRIVHDRMIGEVYCFESHFDRFRPNTKPGWREQDQPGSGILYDLGAHLIDQALVLFGMPEAITADAFAQRPDAHAVDYFHLILEYGKHRVILHSSTLVREPGPRFAVHGEDGSFLKYGIDPQEQELRSGGRPGSPEWGRDHPEQFGLLVRADGTASRIETLKGDYGEFYREVVAALSRAGRVPVNAMESRNGLTVIEAALRSAGERRTVTIA